MSGGGGSIMRVENGHVGILGIKYKVTNMTRWMRHMLWNDLDIRQTRFQRKEKEFKTAFPRKVWRYLTGQEGLLDGWCQTLEYTASSKRLKNRQFWSVAYNNQRMVVREDRVVFLTRGTCRTLGWSLQKRDSVNLNVALRFEIMWK